ncbi:hypothetical protein [Hymenobacter chitinivorans]|uniref:Uncharacterized protein n=1 Tax=Hymenobacter chitinivorans DSM 11115 TaxID=1121954 RepID=A0A2M9BRS2_9BACT|nr:hypothetical protein [Hymenobacter chitinivorans]PJJ60656.1 hypothetical protein CLV45_2087 [Hymenobacter chitinivorans DSM 11115]
MHAPVVFPLGHCLLRWLAYRLFQLALVLAFLLHSVAGFASAFRRRAADTAAPRPTGHFSLPGHA